jgi:transcriptional regulator with XRE-family HTH domain
MAFADRLRFILSVRKMSQVALAKAVGVESQAVSQWVSRVQPVMPVGWRLVKIAQALNVSLPSLMDADQAPIEEMGDLISVSLTQAELDDFITLREMTPERRRALMTLARLPPLVGGSVRKNEATDGCPKVRVLPLEVRKIG